MGTNLFQSKRRTPSAWLFHCICAGFCLFLSQLASADEQDPAERLPAELREKFVPRIVPLEHEDRVLRSAFIESLPSHAALRSIATRVWTSSGGVVLDMDGPGLTLHFYAQGIENMTLTDRVWEGFPRRADTMQGLIDHAITRSREAKQPIALLIIAGHAGLPGCAAFGGTIDDCAFRGRLSGYQKRQLARLRPYLAIESEIELRQCVTGSGKEGQRLLTSIYEITGAATSSYLADFHFGDAAAHPRVRVGDKGFELVRPNKN